MNNTMIKLDDESTWPNNIQSATVGDIVYLKNTSPKVLCEITSMNGTDIEVCGITNNETNIGELDNYRLWCDIPD